MNEKQFITWGNFQKTKLSNKLRPHEVTLVWELHSILINKYENQPCQNCNDSKKVWNGMIEDLDNLYETYKP